jgi:hypothetical protein
VIRACGGANDTAAQTSPRLVGMTGMGPIEAIASNSPAVPVFEVVFTFPPFCSPHAASLKTLQSARSDWCAWRTPVWAKGQRAATLRVTAGGCAISCAWRLLFGLSRPL